VARPSLRPEQIESFRERLCDVAMETFAEQGYEAVTLRGLAEQLGCSHATPYRYFADKQEIFAAVCALGFERFADALERAARGVDDPEQRLRALARAYFRFATTQPHAYRIMFELRESESRTHPRYKVKEIRSWQVLLQAVELAVQAGVLAGDPDEVAHQMWAGLHGLVSLQLAGKLSLGKSAKSLLEPLLDTMIDGSRPRAGSRRRR
jgi:AcrR family transcriptional regulator